MSIPYSCSTNSANRLSATVFFFIFASCSYVFASPRTIEIKLSQTSYQVEVALTPAQRRQGLMYRDQLARNEGMLLVYAKSGDHRVWMKNMRIPLRVLWIDEKFTVLSVQRLDPCLASPCPVFSSPLPARYILELSDDDHAVKPGDKIEGLTDL